MQEYKVGDKVTFDDYTGKVIAINPFGGLTPIIVSTEAGDTFEFGLDGRSLASEYHTIYELKHSQAEQ